MQALKIPYDPGLYDWLALGTAGNAGLRKGKRIETKPGEKGCVVFGPYLALPQGRYRVVFGFDLKTEVDRGVPQRRGDAEEARGERAVYLDVVSGLGARRHGALEIAEGELKSGKYCVSFEIGEEDEELLLEARAWTNGKYGFAVTSVNVEPMDGAPALENGNTTMPMPEELAQGVHFGIHFPMHDKYWVQMLAVARNCVQPRDILFAPYQFLAIFQNALPYILIDKDRVAEIDWMILQKSHAAEMGLRILHEVKQRLTPIFANEIFVILSNKRSAEKYTFDPRHVQALWLAVDELERASANKDAEEKVPKYGAVITTYNRPWALARSLPQVVRLGCPVVVVNDGSDSKHEAGYRKIREIYPGAGITWINLPENRGVACGINMGVSYLLGDPSIDWISYFQDDVDVHPEIFEYLAKVQDRTERPLLTGRRAVKHPVMGEAEINGMRVLCLRSSPGQHFHAHRSYWSGVMPLPSFEMGLPKPQRGSGCDWWIGSSAPNSVCKKGMRIICVPGLVSTFASKPEESTWGFYQPDDDGLLGVKAKSEDDWGDSRKPREGGVGTGRKIFGIGLSRTGTTSLTRALRHLGYRSIHYPPLHTLAELLRYYDAATDTPIACNYRELDARYPGSRFILTVRDIDSWLESTEAFFAQPAPTDAWRIEVRMRTFGTLEWDRGVFLDVYRRHVEGVLEYFADRPGQLLVLDIIAGEGWEKLCPFLEAPVPAAAFPHANARGGK